MLINRNTMCLVMTLSVAAGSTYAATFGDLDANGDNQLELSEFQAAFGDAQGTIYFEAYNGAGETADAFVTPEEIVAYNQANFPAEDGNGPQLTESEFETADVNEDGVISKGEMLDHFGPAAQVALAKFDGNGDGIVTLDEVRSSDDPVGERGRGQLERSTKDSDSHGNSGDRSDGGESGNNGGGDRGNSGGGDRGNSGGGDRGNSSGKGRD
ncbi:hypothetical protein [Yoonia sp.]|uniref:EF-hand domain-containing protein n=1 Tax=Yoonia sp. TaxID=2212373 RepID=UPI0025F79796|nr:hypothetical protein [Yoonia sp.]